jgi:hypothetical protein
MTSTGGHHHLSRIIKTRSNPLQLTGAEIWGYNVKCRLSLLKYIDPNCTCTQVVPKYNIANRAKPFKLSGSREISGNGPTFGKSGLDEARLKILRPANSCRIIGRF